MSGAPATTGDSELVDRLTAAAADRRYRALHAVEITADGVRHAGVGVADPKTTPGGPIGAHDSVELGSITKTFSGLLLADAVERGEIDPASPVRRYLPELESAPLADVTIDELATHTGGVPPLPPRTMLRGLFALATNTDPYRSSTRASVLLEIADVKPMKTRGEVAYSNLGATLLGWCLAAACATEDWRTLAQQRLLAPLGMKSTVFASSTEQVPRRAVQGSPGPDGAPSAGSVLLTTRPGAGSGRRRATWPAMRGP